jgi:hypothetical protein
MSRRSKMIRLAASVLIALAHGLLVPSAAFALDCEPSLTTAIRTVETQVDVLADLSVAQRDDDNVGWVRGELALIRDACSRGREVEAVWRIEAVQRRIIAAHKWMARRASCRVRERVDVHCVHSPSKSSARRQPPIAPQSARASLPRVETFPR